LIQHFFASACTLHSAQVCKIDPSFAICKQFKVVSFIVVVNYAADRQREQ